MKTSHKKVIEALHEHNKRSLRSIKGALLAATLADFFNTGGGGDPGLLLPPRKRP
jgi:hypothetical protein